MSLLLYFCIDFLKRKSNIVVEGFIYIQWYQVKDMGHKYHSIALKEPQILATFLFLSYVHCLFVCLVFCMLKHFCKQDRPQCRLIYIILVVFFSLSQQFLVGRMFTKQLWEYSLSRRVNISFLSFFFSFSFYLWRDFVFVLFFCGVFCLLALGFLSCFKENNGEKLPLCHTPMNIRKGSFSLQQFPNFFQRLSKFQETFPKLRINKHLL